MLIVRGVLHWSFFLKHKVSQSYTGWIHTVLCHHKFIKRISTTGFHIVINHQETRKILSWSMKQHLSMYNILTNIIISRCQVCLESSKCKYLLKSFVNTCWITWMKYTALKNLLFRSDTKLSSLYRETGNATCTNEILLLSIDHQRRIKTFQNWRGGICLEFPSGSRANPI